MGRLAVVVLSTALLAGSAKAQAPSGLDRIDALQQQSAARQRAINLARDTAVRLNGGLSRYVPEACMFASGGRGGSCLVRSSSKGFLFRFKGGAPGWQQLGLPASTRSEILISADGRQVLEVLLNEPLR